MTHGHPTSDRLVATGKDGKPSKLKTGGLDSEALKVVEESNHLLKEVVQEIKISNLHLAKMSGETFTKDDIE